MPWTTNAGLAADPMYEGQIFTTLGQDIIERHAQMAIRAGLLVQRGTAANQAAPLAALPAADPDAILVGPFAPVVAGQTLIDVAGAPGGVLDGATGPVRAMPARAMTCTFSAHANWGLAAFGGTWCYWLGMISGRIVREDFFLPAGGGVTITSEQAFDTAIALYIGACDGAGGGTATWGYSNGRVVLTNSEYGIAGYDLATEPSATATVTYDANEKLPVVVDGIVAVVNELTNNAAALVGDPVMVRVVLAGLDVRGQFAPATSPLNGNFALLEGAQWLDATAAGAIGRVRIGGR